MSVGVLNYPALQGSWVIEPALAISTAFGTTSSDWKQRKDLLSEIKEKPGWTCFLNTISLLSCVSVHMFTWLLCAARTICPSLQMQRFQPELVGSWGWSIRTAKPHPPNLMAELGRQSPWFSQISINIDGHLCSVSLSS